MKWRVKFIVNVSTSLGVKLPLSLAEEARLLLIKAQVLHVDKKIFRDTENVYFPIIRKENILSKYPGTKRTYFTISEGTFTGGNIAIVSPQVVLDNIDLIADLFERRKNVLKQVRVIGITSLLKYFFGKLSLSEIEEKAEKMIKAHGKAIIYSGVEIGIDVDKKVDLVLVEDVLGRRK